MAIVLDWSSVTWASGSLSQSFDIDPNNPGNDITITISGDTSAFINNTPAISQQLNGGNTPPPDSLLFRLNFASPTSQIVVTVAFNYSDVTVDSVNFNLYDIDKPANNTIDYLSNISGLNTSSVLVPAQITASTKNQLSGTDLNQAVTGTGASGDSDSSGNVGISFGTNTVSQVSFTFGNSPTVVGNNPGDQNFALGDISFSPKPKFPEFHPAWAAIGFCSVLVLLRAVRRKNASPVNS